MFKMNELKKYTKKNILVFNNFKLAKYNNKIDTKYKKQ